MNSRPAASAICASSSISHQSARQRLDTLVKAVPPAALIENSPNLKPLGFDMGFGFGRSAVRASAVSVAGWFQSQLVLHGDAIALQEGDRTLSYRALNERVKRLAHWLLANKVTRGDRIAVLSDNRSEYVEIELA